MLLASLDLLGSRAGKVGETAGASVLHPKSVLIIASDTSPNLGSGPLTVVAFEGGACEDVGGCEAADAPACKVAARSISKVPGLRSKAWIAVRSRVPPHWACQTMWSSSFVVSSSFCKSWMCASVLVAGVAASEEVPPRDGAASAPANGGGRARG